MHTDGDFMCEDSTLNDLIRELRASDFSITTKKLTQILSFDKQLTPHLERILQEALDCNATLDISSHKNPEPFAVVHAFYLMAQLQSEKSLDLVLDLLSAKQPVIDYWLHDIVQDDLWEVIFQLGKNRLVKLEEFVLDSRNNLFSRLMIVTTLVQLALHFESKKPAIINTFEKILALEEEEPDFIGLVVSELLDLCEESLQTPIVAALQKNHVWAGIITQAQVNRKMHQKRVRRLRPLGIFERYRLLRQNPYVGIPTPNAHSEVLRQFKSLNLM